MAFILYFLAIIACFVIYANHIDALKRIRDKEATTINTIIGGICIFIIYLAIISF